MNLESLHECLSEATGHYNKGKDTPKYIEK